MVRDNCPQTTLVLAVGEENLTISCHEVVSHTQAGTATTLLQETKSSNIPRPAPSPKFGILGVVF